jgi:hypothetical protein
MEDLLRSENEQLRLRIAELETQLKSIQNTAQVQSFSSSPFPDFPKGQESPLSKTEVERYGRQLIMNEIGASGMSQNGIEAR